MVFGQNCTYISEWWWLMMMMMIFCLEIWWSQSHILQSFSLMSAHWFRFEDLTNTYMYSSLDRPSWFEWVKQAQLKKSTVSLAHNQIVALGGEKENLIACCFPNSWLVRQVESCSKENRSGWRRGETLKTPQYTICGICFSKLLFLASVNTLLEVVPPV